MTIGRERAATRDAKPNSYFPNPPFAILQGMDATIGLIVLDSDRNVIAQHRRLLPETVRIETAPVELKDGIVTNAALAAMFDSDQLEIAALELAARDSARILFCCTSGSLINGPGWDQVIADRIERASGVAGSTTTSAVLAALRALNARTIAIGTPYIAEVDERERVFFEQRGFTVAHIEGLGCYTDSEIAEVTPVQIQALAQRVNRPDADVVFLSCTTLNVAGSIDRIEEALGKPVVTSNQASAWTLMRGLGIEPRPGQFGRLMTMYEETVSI
jgi:maleate isomerase